MKKMIAVTTIVLALFNSAAQAQYSYPLPQGVVRPNRPTLNLPYVPPTPVCEGVQPVYLRNLKYDDYSRYSVVTPTTVAPGGFIQITVNCMPFDGQLRVTIQDTGARGGFGVTGAFLLTNVSRNGNVITAQMPNHPVFHKKSFHVAVFVFGSPWKTANPGIVSIN
jgi:hypothetical protein